VVYKSVLLLIWSFKFAKCLFQVS